MYKNKKERDLISLGVIYATNMCLFLVVESILDENCPPNAGKVCFVSSKSQRTRGGKVHTSLKSDVEV